MKWAFILGGSSGIGLAAARILGSKGYNLFIVHRNRKQELLTVENSFEEIRKNNVDLVSININSNDEQNRDKIIEKLRLTLGNGKIRVLLHSLADGNIKPIFNHGMKSETGFLNEGDFRHTIDAMGISFVVWSKLVFENGLFDTTARIIGLTSEGSTRVMEGYSAVAASKSVLEACCRYMAVELASYGITTNLINAGITDTPALRLIPNSKEILENARMRNPFKRNTQPEDIAKVIYLISTEEAAWINGEIIRVDGGEQLI